MKDKFGREIRPGQYIAHAISCGDTPKLKISIVTEVQYTKCTVKGIDTWNTSPLTLTEKRSTLSCPEKILVLEDSHLPPEYKELLGDWYRDYLEKK